MSPSQIRNSALVEHLAVLHLLGSVEQAAQAALTGGSRGALVRERVELLVPSILEHLAWELTWVLPALREADAWGPQRAEEFLARHSQMHSRLYDLRTTDGHAGAPLAALQASQFLRSAVLVEEHVTLHEHVLRDDVVVIDQMSG